jgi:hypothetical protein
MRPACSIPVTDGRRTAGRRSGSRNRESDSGSPGKRHRHVQMPASVTSSGPHARGGPGSHHCSAEPTGRHGGRASCFRTPVHLIMTAEIASASTIAKETADHLTRTGIGSDSSWAHAAPCGARVSSYDR